MIDRKDDGDLPEGTVAYREYEVVTDTEKGSMAFTLGEPGAETVAARYAKDAGAQAYVCFRIPFNATAYVDLGAPTSVKRFQ